VSFLAFDVLYLLGRSTLELSYDERRSLLDALHLAGSTFATPPSFVDVRVADLLAVSVERGLEGVVAKRRDAPYTPGLRSAQWIKVKNVRTQEVVIGGWTEGKGALAGTLGALLLGIPGDDGLAYAGKVGTGFSDQARAELLTDLWAIPQDHSPFTSTLSRTDTALAHFVRPTLVGEVQYAEWTRDGHLRHPTWRGLRPDKEPGEVAREP